MAGETIKYESRFRKFPEGVTFEIHFVETREWKIRKWIAVQLIKLSAKIMGCGVKFSEEPQK